MKDYDAYLFDWDGTLSCTVEIWLEEIERQFAAYGLSITREENARHFGNLNSPLLFGLPEDQLSEFQSGIDKAAQARLYACPLYDDATTVLNSLKSEGKKLALVTTAQPRTLEVTLKPHGLESLFDIIINAADVAVLKPDPEGINKALKHLGVGKDRALMLGDTDKDLLAAKNAGIDSLLFYPDSHKLLHSLEDLSAHNPRFTIGRWQELIDQLQ